MAAKRAPSQVTSFHHRNAPSVARLVAQQISTGCLSCFPCFPMFAKNWRNVSSNCPWHSHSVKFLFRCFVSGRHKNCRTESKCRDGEPNWPDFSFLLKAWTSTAFPHTALIPWSSTKFRALFEEGLVATNLQHYKFKPYSLRRGGATDQWLLTKNYAQVSHLGRWSSEKTLKVYIQDSVALLTTLQFQSSPTQQRWTSYWLAFASQTKRRGTWKEVKVKLCLS